MGRRLYAEFWGRKYKGRGSTFSPPPLVQFKIAGDRLSGLFAQQARKTPFKDVLNALIQRPAKIYKEPFIFSLISPSPVDDEWVTVHRSVSADK